MLAPVLLFTTLQRQIGAQERCARIVAADLERTRVEKPAVYATIRGHMFEWSRSRAACVLVMQYRTTGPDGSPEVQVLAVNAVTMQPMDGYDNIFLARASDQKQIMDAMSFLMKRYSK